MPTNEPPVPPPADAPPDVRERYLRDSEAFYGEGLRRGVAVATRRDATKARLVALQRDADRFLDEHTPFTSALWLAMLRPSAAVVRDFKRMRKVIGDIDDHNADTTAPSDDPSEPDIDAADSPPAIIALANAMVVRGIAGDVHAINSVADRLEGKPGQRKGDVDPDAEAKRDQMRAGIEDFVRVMTEQRLAKADDSRIIDVTPSNVGNDTTPSR
jgi:hypothetical protein